MFENGRQGASDKDGKTSKRQKREDTGEERFVMGDGSATRGLDIVIGRGRRLSSLVVVATGTCGESGDADETGRSKREGVKKGEKEEEEEELRTGDRGE